MPLLRFAQHLHETRHRTPAALAKLRDLFLLVVSLQGEIVDIACDPLHDNAATSRCCFML
jgi:hypothetical protein